MKNFLLFISISLLFFGCDDETLPSGGGKARFILNCPQPGQLESCVLSAGTGTSITAPGATDLFSVTKGQNVACVVQYITQGTCVNVEVKFELNGSIIETRNLSMGYTTCQDGVQKQLNFIVP